MQRLSFISSKEKNETRGSDNLQLCNCPYKSQILVWTKKKKTRKMKIVTEKKSVRIHEYVMILGRS